MKKIACLRCDFACGKWARTMPRRSRKCFIGLAFVTIVLIVWLANSGSRYSRTCMYNTEYLNKLLSITYRVHSVLDKLQLLHCLCYNALWGAIHKGTALPWEADAKFCVFNEQLYLMDESFMIRSFRNSNLTLSYNSAEGYFTVKDQSTTNGMDVKLVVFETIGEDMMRRVGWKRRLLPPNCDNVPSLECFPSRLVMSPLPKKLFGSQLLPAPREDIEMLKYHYPHNWWLDIVPYNCN